MVEPFLLLNTQRDRCPVYIRGYKTDVLRISPVYVEPCRDDALRRKLHRLPGCVHPEAAVNGGGDCGTIISINKGLLCERGPTSQG
ncbi:hypothetical protein PFLUV_G00153170 [Perca fluviatilis]|uniref:Uncharacterized protein n=1 Tax=Perca fluviatilis TaxID=8168 RepID=A0A6A5F095_PERFL|nr:hypothetical protein PFLUV_G00153170 [Perca fluviatilis]